MAPTLLENLPPLTSPLGLTALAVTGLFLAYLIERYLLSVPYPPGMPLLREPEGATRFSLKTRLAYYTDCAALFREAYDDYSKKGKPVVIPGIGCRKEVILPISNMRWVLSQPDEHFNVTHAFAEVDQVRWSLGHDKLITDPWQGGLVKTDMNRVLENLCAAMNNELGVAFDDEFGTDMENWKELDLTASVQRVVAQAASRFTVGLPLCRDQDYLKLIYKINKKLIVNAGASGGMPNLIRPAIGSIFKLATYLDLEKMKKYFMPLYKERMEYLKYDRDDPNNEEPQDHLQMMLRYAQRERPDELHDAGNIMRRLAAQNFGSVHNTQMQVVNLILNVLGSDAEFNTIAVLRDEIERVLGSDNSDLWTKAKVSQLSRADSVSRETLRLGAFGGRANFRKIMVDGITTPDGYHLPRGTVTSFLSQPAHVDPETTEDPMKFDPFRFSRVREIAAANDEKVVPKTMVTTGPDFMAFGHGKHACPGRFLIDFELKMIMAYVLKNYDIRFPESYGGKRPPNTWVAEAVFPPDGAKIQVKRRKV